MEKALSEKVVLVTGGGQGLGAAISKTLADAGAIVLPTDIKLTKLTQTADEIRKSGGSAYEYELDVCDDKRVESVIKSIVDKHGRIDAVINNAGIDFTKPIEELTYEEWNKVIQVNLNGPFNVAKAAYAYLAKK